ncbi:MAG: response regulator, partial [Sulfuricurvum sp.]|nr:response regulator [Sulfuricurvum sp.]
MDYLKILIVDDDAANRLILNDICQSMKTFEIKEAQDGIEAIELAEQWHPHIILMDIMMPRLDGFEASKIIKNTYPEIIIIAIVSVVDREVEAHISSIGINAYIHKPINSNLIRYKLQSFSGLFDCKEGKNKALSKNLSLNLFGAHTRHFKTIFEIINTEAMMDFGMWVLARSETKSTGTCTKVDVTLEVFYQLMNHGIRNGNSLSIIVEENFDDTFITMTFEKALVVKNKMIPLLEELGSGYIIRDNVVSIRFPMDDISEVIMSEKVSNAGKVSIKAEVQPVAIITVEVPTVAKETRPLHSNEEQMLRQSFVHKTTAVEYVRDIGGDVLDEIRDLESLDEEWREKLLALEDEPMPENIQNFVDGVLRVYVHAINSLFEFTALGYALSSLGSFLKENADMIIGDPKKLKMMVMLMEHLGADLASWREHIFGLQDAGDIHYLDSSFFSSCMQIEGIIGD